MAKLHEEDEVEEDFPELSDIMDPTRHEMRKLSKNDGSERNATDRAMKKEQKIAKTTKKKYKSGEDELSRCQSSTVEKKTSEEKQVRKQKPLRPTHVNSLLLPISNISLQPTKQSQKLTNSSESEDCRRPSPNRTGKRDVNYRTIVPDLDDIAQSTEADDSYDSLLDFIVYDSETEPETKPSRSIGKTRSRSPKKVFFDPKPRPPWKTSIKQGSSISKAEPVVADLLSPIKDTLFTSNIRPQAGKDTTSTELPEPGDPFAEDPCANLRL